MAWTLRYGRYARAAIDDLPVNIAQRVEKTALLLGENPHRGKLLKGYERERIRSLPVTTTGGEYRIIYELIPQEEAVFVLLCETREEVYKLLRRTFR
ncbi:MAG: type II toxin-antitoxin system RelE/ParE family toxin [Nitrospirae bacterium]|nr:type II toxin-antitoxin system RelE/ParE family toxin [Nitrospirota bacterium]